jgi:asparagine N-glycosylation enzyme membrane subunit Stt3
MAVEAVTESAKRRISGKSTMLLMLAIVLVLASAIYLRVLLIQYPGFFEPDGFYNYAVVNYAVAHGFSVPKYLSISGQSAGVPVNEPSGLYWVALLPYAVLQHLGISVYSIMRFISVLFGLFDIIGAYYLSRFISKDRVFGLLVIALVGLSAANASKTMALEYRGDGFVTIFLIFALISIGMVINEKRRSRKVLYALLGAVSLSICNLVWNGASFAVAVYAISIVLLASYAFIAANKELLRNMLYILSGLFIWFMLAMLFSALGYIHGQQYQAFVGPDFIALPFALLAGWFVLWLILEKKIMRSAVTTTKGRLKVLGMIFLIGTVIFYLSAYGFLYQTLIAEGLFSSRVNLLSSIQELATPNLGFLFANFNITLLMSPMGLMMVFSSILPAAMFVFFAALVASSFLYVLIRISGSGGWLNGSFNFTKNIRPEMLILIAYLAVTAYLQMLAERFASLVSVPTAIFSAVTLYLIILFVKSRTPIKYKIRAYFTTAVIIIAFFAVILHYDLLLAPASPTDSTVPYLLNASSWLEANTPQNSVVLTLWPDGSVVEGWANRTSVTDSVGSQNPSKITAFASWLLNRSSDPNFLTSSSAGHPNYLLVRSSWLEETTGIFIESGMNQNLSGYYGVKGFAFTNESTGPTGTSIRLSGIDSEIYLHVQNNSAAGIMVYNTSSDKQAVPIEYIEMYNIKNGNFSVQENYTGGSGLSSLLIVMYSDTNSAKHNMPLNITGAVLAAPYLAGSNLIKLLYLCNYNACVWNSNNTSVKLVQVYPNSTTGFNPNTKIFRIEYVNATGTR